MKNLFFLISILLFSTKELLCNNNISQKIQNLTQLDQILLFISFCAISVGILSSGYALCISLSAYAGCEKEKRSIAFIPALMPGSQGLYSFAICFIMLQEFSNKPLLTAFAGVICGFPCLLSAIGQARSAAACIKSISNDQMEQGQALLTTGVTELYALCGLAGAFLAISS